MEPTPACNLCLDTGWIAVEDPILGGTVDHRCPDCWHPALIPAT